MDPISDAVKKVIDGDYIRKEVELDESDDFEYRVHYAGQHKNAGMEVDSRKVYKNLKSANRVVDKLDAEYGGVAHGVKKVPKAMKTEQKNIIIPPHPLVKDHLEKHGYTVTDFVAGKATDQHGREVNIGKVLTKTKASPEVMHAFVNDETRSYVRPRERSNASLDNIGKVHEELNREQIIYEEEVTTDTLTGRETGGKANSFKSFKLKLRSGDEMKAPEVEKCDDTKEKQKTTTNPGSVDIKQDDKLTGPTPYTHFANEKSITSGIKAEEVDLEEAMDTRADVPAYLRKGRGDKPLTPAEISAKKPDTRSAPGNVKMSPLDRVKRLADSTMERMKKENLISSESVERINEESPLNQYISAMGLDPDKVPLAKKIGISRSSAYLTWLKRIQL
jgi:hypothetical protein